MLVCWWRVFCIAFVCGSAIGGFLFYHTQHPASPYWDADLAERNVAWQTGLACMGGFLSACFAAAGLAMTRAGFHANARMARCALCRCVVAPWKVPGRIPGCGHFAHPECMAAGMACAACARRRMEEDKWTRKREALAAERRKRQEQEQEYVLIEECE